MRVHNHSSSSALRERRYYPQHSNPRVAVQEMEQARARSQSLKRPSWQRTWLPCLPWVTILRPAISANWIITRQRRFSSCRVSIVVEISRNKNQCLRKSKPLNWSCLMQMEARDTLMGRSLSIKTTILACMHRPNTKIWCRDTTLGIILSLTSWARRWDRDKARKKSSRMLNSANLQELHTRTWLVD